MPFERLLQACSDVPVLADRVEIGGIDAAGLDPGQCPRDGGDAGQLGDRVRAAVAGWSPAPILVRGIDEKHDAFAAAAAGLIKSGTSSLEVAMAGVPMVVGYRLNPVTAWLIRRMAKVKYVSIVNILADEEVIPERLLEDCRPPRLAAVLDRLLEGEGVAEQRAGFARVMSLLSPPGGGSPSEAAARAVLEALGPER